MNGEIISAAELGSLAELETILARVERLPEFGKFEKLDAIKSEITDGVKALESAKKRLATAREKAVNFLRGLSEWTNAEIFAATGYNGPNQ